MSVIGRMLDTYPQDLGRVDREKLRECIEACLDCAESCTACAQACLGEAAVSELVTCIRSTLDCADICDATGRVLSRHTVDAADLARAVLEACAVACTACGAECSRHAGMHEHCRICAETCRRCEQACRALLGAMS